jgi:hypothetical protein
MARGFLISDGLRQDIKRTIVRVDGMVDGPGATKIPTRFESLPASAGKVFRICTFTGAWAINGEKTVTFRGVTTTPNTVSALNLFFPVTSTATNATTDCAIAKDGTAWYLVDIPFETATAVFIRATQSTSQVTDITLSATLNTSNCAITIGKTLVTATAIFVQTTFTSTFVRFRE